ncbi:MAG: pyridoxamine 5'-phosphate oxidase [Flavobacteriaceae bacterium]|nr:pyridoxamine 5'-phosphate oxidase [Flavobacteriaceae bacterium]PHX76428.1 MAG: pyridoxamine 5'-phosphate oxidase [Flavobacteriales bacterium]
MKNIADLRKEYTKGALEPNLLGDTPLPVFSSWFSQALESEVLEVNAMILSSVNALGRPSSRVVLLKDITENGIIFYTNYQSRKGLELESNPFVSVVFYWAELERQVRMEGQVRKVSEADSDAYFYSRPRISQAGAVVSNQSRVIPDRQALDDKMDTLMTDTSIKIQRPNHWGGYEIVVDRVEFWQGRPGRVHDRALYEKEDGAWIKSRLSP